MRKSTVVTISIGQTPRHPSTDVALTRPSGPLAGQGRSRTVQRSARSGARAGGEWGWIHAFMSTHAAHTVGTITLARPCTVFYIRPGRDGGWYDLLDVTPVTLSVIRTRYVISTPVTISVSSHKVKKKEAKYYTETSSSVLQDLMCLSSD